MDYEFKYRKYAEALYAALANDAFYRTMEKSVYFGSSKEAMLRYLDYSIIESEAYGKLFVPESQDYGISVWSRPLNQYLAKEKSKRKKAFLTNHMGRKSLEIYTAITKFMSKKSDPFIDHNAWYLSILGVLPAFQGQGLGAGLVETALETTDGLGVPTYLETFTPRTIKFYNRLGYDAVTSFHEPTTRAEYWLMIRDTKRA